jgi:hypothetical protein
VNYDALGPLTRIYLKADAENTFTNKIRVVSPQKSYVG